MNIIEFAVSNLGLRLSCLQRDLLLTLQNDSDFVKQVRRKSHDMVVVMDVYSKWRKYNLVCA